MSNHHVIKDGVYEELYDAPSVTDREAWNAWREEAIQKNLGPTPLEWHVDDCPGCDK